jgi:hypothetical protein
MCTNELIRSQYQNLDTDANNNMHDTNALGATDNRSPQCSVRLSARSYRDAMRDEEYAQLTAIVNALIAEDADDDEANIEPQIFLIYAWRRT